MPTSEPTKMDTIQLEEAIHNAIQRNLKRMTDEQVRAEAELVASLEACGWKRSTIKFPLLHLATADQYRWAKVSFAEIGCWQSPSGCVFLTRLDQYNLEQEESEAKTKSLSEPFDVAGLLGIDDE